MDKSGDPLFKLEIVQEHEAAASFNLQVVVAFPPENKLADILYEPYVSGGIKFDGCSHVYFGPVLKSTATSGDQASEQGYLHFCGKRDWQLHCMAMELVYKEVTKYITDFMEDESWCDALYCRTKVE